MSHITAEYAKHEHNPRKALQKTLSPEFYLRASEAELKNVAAHAAVFPLETVIVGNAYRNSQQQSALRNKNPGNRVLVVPEPGNVHDRAALAVLVAKGISSNQFVWTHVGYIPREVAAELSKVWPRYRGRLLVGEGRLIGPPATEANPRIVLEPSFRDYWHK